MKRDTRRALAHVAVAVVGAACIVGYAKAKPIGYAKTPDGSVTVVLTDDRGNCPEGLRKALWVEQGGQLGGCYWQRGDMLFFGWDDNDVHALPAKLFKQSDA